jgi:hypothetical protein
MVDLVVMKDSECDDELDNECDDKLDGDDKST